MKTILKLSLCFYLLVNVSVNAEVVTDGSLGAVSHLSGQMEIPQSLGTATGDNLFHSFSQFKIDAGESVTFTGDNTLKNVVSRVTGGQLSNINGLLQSTIGNANFYFINPAGVTFGVEARVDVPAAFHVSTADILRFADGSQFSAINPAASILTVAEPSGFGFISTQGGDIQVNGSTLNEFKEGSSVSLTGHNVVLDGGYLSSPSGNIQIAATGNVPTELPLNIPVTKPLTGRVELKPASFLDTSGNSGGTINIQGGDVRVDNSLVISDTLGDGQAGSVNLTANRLTVANNGQISSDTYGQGHAGSVTIKANETIVDNGFIFSNALDSTGNAGTVSISGQNLSVLGLASVIASNTYSTGNAGNIVINTDQTSVDQGSIYSDARLGSTGNAGKITINSKNLSLSNLGWIKSDSETQGHAGNIEINADTLRVLSEGQISSSAFDAGNAGSIVINSKDSIVDKGIVYSDTFEGTGNAGSVSINSDNLAVLNEGWISSDTYSTGHAGVVSVTSNHLNIANNGRITSTTTGSGNAGSVVINSQDTVIDGGLVFSDAQLFSTGNGGSISITSPQLNVINTGWISSDTSGTGNGGSVSITTNNLTMANKARITTTTSNAGHAGNININAQRITLDNARISAEATANSQGQTGNVSINANQALSLANKASISLKNDATMAGNNAVLPSSITVSSPDIALKDSKITTEATGNADAADININFSRNLTLDPSFITTTANTGNGGNITVRGGQLIQLQNSGFLTSVSGANGNGGNINVRSDYLVMDTGVIQANAVGGSGGNINLDLKALIPSQNRLILGGRRVDWQPFRSGLNVIQAASENGVSGAINVTSPQFDISASISGLDSSQLVLPDIDNSLCQSSAMLASSLSRGGKGGIPVDEAQYGFIPPASTQSQSNTGASARLSTSQSGATLPCASLQH